MAKTRMINTKIWSDSWIRQKLNPLDRYLFIYLLTNEHTNICGIYELPIETMAFEVGIEKDDLINSYFPRLKPKIIYKDNWIILVNFLKHQNTKSPTVQKGIDEEIKRIPKDILDLAIGYGYGMHTISHLNLNININSNININAKKEKTLQELFDEEIKIDPNWSFEGQELFKKRRAEFLEYWTAKNKNDKRERWQVGGKFYIKLRWNTWNKQGDRYQKEKEEKQKVNFYQKENVRVSGPTGLGSIADVIKSKIKTT
jgi:hypothetical protein